MRIVHPNLPDQVADVPDSVYTNVLRHHDWTPAPDPLDTGDKTVAEVLAEVSDDPAKAAAALESERSGRERSTLTEALTRIAGTPPQPHPDQEQ